MPSDEDIIEFEGKARDSEAWVRRLSDEKFVALDTALEIEKYEFQLQDAKEQLIILKKRAKKLPVPPDIKGRSFISLRTIRDNMWRFRGRKEIQEKLYNYTKGTLTDSGW
jgi:hypothetical protein